MVGGKLLFMETKVKTYHGVNIPQKDKDRREGKGRRCCLGDSLDSIPCHPSYFAPGQFEEQNELYQGDMKNRMNCARLLSRLG